VLERAGYEVMEAQDGFLEIARRLGAQRTLSKPFELSVLLAAVRELLQEIKDAAQT
jgi:hypothetical protein